MKTGWQIKDLRTGFGKVGGLNGGHNMIVDCFEWKAEKKTGRDRSRKPFLGAIKVFDLLCNWLMSIRNSENTVTNDEELPKLTHFHASSDPSASSSCRPKVAPIHESLLPENVLIPCEITRRRIIRLFERIGNLL
jgi:hypothetical protein